MGEIYVTVNFVKVILVRVVVVVAVVFSASMCTLSVLTQKGVREEKKPHRISCDMPQYFPLTR